MSLTATDPANRTGKTNTWLTPLPLVRSLGEFDLDPCGFPGHETAKRLICLPEDGLSAEWEGRVWLNPPYGENTQAWIEKLSVHGNGIALTFARTDTQWFQRAASMADTVCFLTGRVWFLDEAGKKVGAPGAPSVLLAFGRDNARSLFGVRGLIGVLK